MKTTVLLFTIILVTLTASAQSYSGSGNYNRLGIQGKYALLDINTSDFEIKGESGFMGGLTTRGRVYNNFGMVYGIDFLSAEATVRGRPLGEVAQEDMRYTIIGAQLNVLLSYNIIGNNLAIDFGPALLVNGKMKLQNNGQKDNIVSGYTSLRGEDIQDISRINAFGIVGVTGGFEHVRLSVQYQYGFTNIFGNLNQVGLGDVDPNARNFKGTATVITAGVVFYL